MIFLLVDRNGGSFMECTMTLDPSLCPDAELRTEGTFAGMYLPRPAANGDVHLIWKLKGTGKQNRLETIASCTKEQPVFIICNSNGSNCTVITENGDEIGKLNKTDAKLYHQYVEKFRYHVYIKSIKRELEKPRVRICGHKKKPERKKSLRLLCYSSAMRYPTRISVRM